jgi:nitronate monooxygenase
MTAATGPGEQAVISTPLTELLEVDHPILLAPMGDVAGGRLAAAVSAAGAFGLIGGGYGEPAWLEAELELAAGARVGIGFITFSVEPTSAAFRMALEARPPAVQMSFGDPRPFADPIHAAGALLICQVQTPTEVDLAVAAGADVIVAQGQDAGGHGRPGRGTIGLVPSVVDRVAPIPVVAAGGLADGRGLAAALMLGASGVTLGTRFFAAVESISDDAADAALVRARSEDTVRTSVFEVIRGPAWPEDYNGRAVRNRLIEWWQNEGDDADARPRVQAEYRSTAEDDYSMRPLWAGEGIDLVSSIETAEAIVADVISGAAQRLEGARGLLRQGTTAASVS